MKKLILTIDYELFLGAKTGDVMSCMIDPTYQLASLLAKNDSKMTVFWDVLHYYKLLESQASFPELRVDASAIEEQIIYLINEGHDVQLHLHPHWLDAIYKEGKWSFDYSGFKLHRLSKKEDPKDIKTILGCITISKSILENLIWKVKSDYKVTTFRAGGYLIQPFSELKNALLRNSILMDTSICPGLRNDNGIFSYDFTNYPTRNFYKFSDSPQNISDKGTFFEIPVKTIKIPFIINLYFTLLRHTKYRSLGIAKKGLGAGKSHQKSKSIFQKIAKIFFSKRIYQLSTDSSFEEIFNYILSRVNENSTMILHPKQLNEHNMNLLKDLIERNKVQFNSIEGGFEFNKL